MILSNNKGEVKGMWLNEFVVELIESFNYC
jgi:hypothetical protein